MPDGTETTRTEFVTPKVVQSGHLSPEGSVALCFVNVADDAVAFDLVLSKCAKYLQGPAARISVRNNGDVVSEKTSAIDGIATGLKLTTQRDGSPTFVV